MRALIADDHIIVRNGLKQLLADAFPRLSCVEAGTAAEAVDAVKTHGLDIAVVDLSMPDSTGLDLVSRIKSLAPDLPLLILSMHPADQFSARARALGAQGYITKETAPERLVDAIKEVLSGTDFATDSPGDSNDTELIDAIPVDESVELGAVLSQREMEVMQLLYQGVTLKEIAAQLGLSIKTVSTYRQRILKKLGVSSNAELVQFILR